MTRPLILAIAGLIVSVSPLAMAQDAVPLSEDVQAAQGAVESDVVVPGEDVPIAGGEHGEAQSAHGSASHDTPEPPSMDWSFSGPFGAYDKAALQRGFQVYRQVCSACHSMDRIYYRNLTALGYSEDQAKTVAADVTVMDGPNDEGEMFERPGRTSDPFKAPYENIEAAKYANNGALPPDLSLITKARAGGANYVYGILTGYEEPPEGTQLLQGQHWNKYMPGHVIAMASPLSDGVVAYENADVPQTVDQYAHDVATFLTWASEPEMDVRKQTGIKAIIFLAVFAALMYGVKRRLWSKLH